MKLLLPAVEGMRLLSKIIKNTELQLIQPLKLEIIAEPQAEEKKDSRVETMLEQSLQEQENTEELVDESQKILKETEEIVVELLEKARVEARLIIQNAQEEADVIRNQVYEEAKTMRESAVREGYEAGLKQAQEEMEAERLAALQQKEEILEEARRSKLDILSRSELDMLHLVVAIAKKVIASELLLQPESIITVIRQAIEQLDHPDNLKVYVHPDDIQVVLDAIEFDELTEIGSQSVQTEVKADQRINRGGCVVESDCGSVDARLESRIAKVEDGLYSVTDVTGNE